MSDSKQNFYRALSILIWTIIIIIVLFTILYLIGTYNIVTSEGYQEYKDFYF